MPSPHTLLLPLIFDLFLMQASAECVCVRVSVTRLRKCDDISLMVFPHEIITRPLSHPGSSTRTDTNRLIFVTAIKLHRLPSHSFLYPPPPPPLFLHHGAIFLFTHDSTTQRFFFAP